MAGGREGRHPSQLGRAELRQVTCGSGSGARGGVEWSIGRRRWRRARERRGEGARSLKGGAATKQGRRAA